MSKVEWSISDEPLYGLPSIKHKVTKELTLMGKHGEIYEFSDELAVAIVRSPKVLAKIVKATQVGVNLAFRSGEEIRIKIPKDLVRKMAKLLKVPRTRPSQIRRASALQNA